MRHDETMVTNASSGAGGLDRFHNGSSTARASAALPTATTALAILCLIGFLNYLDRMILAAALPAIKADFALTDSEAGLLSTGFGLIYAIAGLPLGRATDRLPRNRLIVAALGFWSVATLLCGVTTSFYGLMLARMGVALGEAAFVPAAFSMLSDYYLRDRRHVAMTKLVVCISLGTAIGLALGGIMTAAFGWRSAFLAAGGPGIALALVGWRVLREPAREPSEFEASGQIAPSAMRSIVALGSNRLFVWLALTTGLNGFAIVGIVQWLPSHFSRSFGVTLGEIGLAFGLGFGIGTAAGHLLGGLAAARLARRSASSPILLCIAANLLIIPGYTAALLVPSLTGAGVLVLFTAMIAASGAVAQGVAVQNAVLPRQRGLAQSISGMLVAVMGLAIGPLAVGVLSDHFATTARPGEALRQALFCSEVFFALGSYAAWRAYRASRRLEEFVLGGSNAMARSG